jgi:hypothetical protein
LIYVIRRRVLPSKGGVRTTPETLVCQAHVPPSIPFNPRLSLKSALIASPAVSTTPSSQAISRKEVHVLHPPDSTVGKCDDWIPPVSRALEGHPHNNTSTPLSFA